MDNNGIRWQCAQFPVWKPATKQKQKSLARGHAVQTVASVHLPTSTGHAQSVLRDALELCGTYYRRLAEVTLHGKRRGPPLAQPGTCPCERHRVVPLWLLSIGCVLTQQLACRSMPVFRPSLRPSSCIWLSLNQ